MFSRITSPPPGTSLARWLGLSLAIACAPVAVGCGHPAENTGGGGGGGTGNAAGSGGATGGTGGGAGGIGGSVPQTCVPFASPDQPIQKLSQTGCVGTDPKTLAASVFAYEVNSPLWSDGADKSRGLALPNGGKIRVTNCTTNPTECPGPRDKADEGKWRLPVGTVLVKSFLFDGKLLETRLLMQFTADNWVGYTYKWDEAQTDATLVGEDRDQVMFKTGQRTVNWHFPSRDDCTKCHTPAAGYSLGPETAQMNRMVGGMNQIDKLAAMGAFETPVAKPYKAALVTPETSQPASIPAGDVEKHATSYLHANCGFCHRPPVDIDCTADPCQDLRYGLDLAVRNLCNVDPSKNSLGVTDPKNLAPGHPERSLMYVRMNALPDDAQGKHGRMPPLASYVVDKGAVDLLGRWITSISACP